MRRIEFERSGLILAAIVLGLNLASARADDLKLDWPPTTDKSAPVEPQAGGAPDANTDLEARLKQLDATANQGRGNISLGVSGAVGEQVTHVGK